MARVLVIDDSPTVVMLVRRLLAADGHDVVSLSNFAELPGMLRESPPDLVLLDLEMPALTGLAFGGFLRRCQTKPTPVLVHSSRPVKDLEEAVRAVNAVGYVEKGRPPEELRRMVRLALGRPLGTPAS